MLSRRSGAKRPNVNACAGECLEDTSKIVGSVPVGWKFQALGATEGENRRFPR
jgi:hypothetical protein